MATNTSSCATRRILIVDDEADVRRLVRILLQRTCDGLELDIHEAADGREAIARASEVAPDAIVLDIEMPRLDGIAALPELRRTVPSARIVVFSGRVDRREDALAAGAHVWLGKDRWQDLRTGLFPAER